jgi:diacylglycerol kinase (ATP)
MLERDAAGCRGTVITCGGDGMVHHAVQVLAGTPLDLLPLPGGTANDFSRELGWAPMRAGPVKADPRLVDCIRVNDRLFVTTGGCGAGAKALDRMRRLRASPLSRAALAVLLGRWSYTLLLLGVHRTGARRSYEILGEGIPGSASARSILVCNQPGLAGTFRLPGHIRNDDGKVELLLFGEGSRWDEIRFWAGALAGLGPVRHPAVRRFSSTSFRITAAGARENLLFGDGELFDQVPGLAHDVRVAPSILRAVYRS